MRRARERTEDFPVETMLRVGGGKEKAEKTKGKDMLETLPMLAAEAGNFGPFLPLAFAGLGAGVGVGIVGRQGCRSGGPESQRIW